MAPVYQRGKAIPAVTALMLAAVILALAMPPAGPAAAAAEPPAPVITTPTPVPTATPSIAERRQAWLSTPEAERRGGFLFLPLVLKDHRGAPDVTPVGFAYVVKPGDTLWSLALEFGRDLDTMSCATTPTGADAETLTPGQAVTVPALADLCYTVTPYDTLDGIAAGHGTTVEAIAAVPWNGFAEPPFVVVPRQRVLLPGARPAARPRPDRSLLGQASDSWASTDYRSWPFGDGHFIWPVAGPISQYAHDGHTALDIAIPVGTPILAADRGTVILAGWSAVGYGFRVVIDHGIDYVTLYAHLSDIYVQPDEVVGKGQVIAASGANGNITGPHLHFELRDFGMLTDPLPLLPQ